MQQHYEHSVPKIESMTSVTPKACRRCALVFRHGSVRLVERDTGSPVATVNPPVKCRIYGAIDGLEEGTPYSQDELYEMRAHL
jgi:hypothetical protein